MNLLLKVPGRTLKGYIFCIIKLNFTVVFDILLNLLHLFVYSNFRSRILKIISWNTPSPGISKILTAQKGRPQFGSARTRFVVSIIIPVKLGWRLNITNKIKGQRRLSGRLATVIFRGTPYMFKDIKYKNILIWLCFYYFCWYNLKHFLIINIFLKNWKRLFFTKRNFENLLKVELKTKILGFHMIFLNTDIVAGHTQILTI